jgi:hypothetical protein
MNRKQFENICQVPPTLKFLPNSEKYFCDIPWNSTENVFDASKINISGHQGIEGEGNTEGVKETRSVNNGKIQAD